MVSKASDDLPEPDNPVKTTSLSRGNVRSMSLRLCSRAPRMTISVCWIEALSLPLPLAMHFCPHAARLRLAPLAGLGSGRRGQRMPVFERVATQGDQPIAQPRRSLELQVARRLLHLPLEVLDQPLDLIRRPTGGERRDGLLDRLLLLTLQVIDGFDNGGGRDAMLLVVGDLDRPAPVGLVHRPSHRPGHVVAVEDDVPVDVAGRPANRLNE